MQGERGADGGYAGGQRDELPWPGDAPLFASGTDALAALLRWGVAERGWSRVWLPSYYCPDVPAALRAFPTGVDVLAYPDSDLGAPTKLSAVPAAAGDVVVVANQLGLRRRPMTSRPTSAGAVLVEDHSHDLGSRWAFGSCADYAFASLRKTLTIPDGGVVWSPGGLGRPPEPTAPGGGPTAGPLASAIERRALRPDTGAEAGLGLRALARSSAAAHAPATPGASDAPGSPARRGISPVSRALVPQMPVRAWRERREANLETLAAAIGTPRHATVLTAPEGGVAFALTLVFDTTQARVNAQRALTARAVVPSILWPLDPARDQGTTEADADLSRRIVSVHGDQRFTQADMLVLGGILREALRGL